MLLIWEVPLDVKVDACDGWVDITLIYMPMLCPRSTTFLSAIHWERGVSPEVRDTAVVSSKPSTYMISVAGILSEESSRLSNKNSKMSTSRRFKKSKKHV